MSRSCHPLEPRRSDRVQVRLAGPGDLPGIVRCHLAAFPGQFLSRLGPTFLEAYYRFYLDAPGGINLVAIDSGDRVVGFVSGGDPALRGRFIRTRVPGFLGLLVRQGLRDPFVRRRLRVHLGNLVRTLAGRLEGAWSRRPAAGSQNPKGVSVLLSIAVDPASTGQGIGRRLMEAFRQQSRSLGFIAMELSAHRDNEPAIGLYRACGWEVVSQDADGVYFRRGTDR